MKLYVLTENTASGKFFAEHGLSYYIEYDSHILFDTGHSSVFAQNAKKLNLNLDDIKTVVLSHGHWDHGNGLKFLNEKELVCHPDVFQKRYSKNGKDNIGLELSFSELNEKFDITYTRIPFPVSSKIIFLGEIPRINSFEAQTTTFEFSDGKEDYLLDDSGLVVKLENEIIVISGCAYSGICNIIEYAKKITGISKIRAVIGGFHLKQNNKQTQETINYLKAQDIQEIYPSHCTELPALAAFHSEFNTKQLKAGMVLSF